MTIGLSHKKGAIDEKILKLSGKNNFFKEITYQKAHDTMELGEYVDALKRKRKLLKRQVKAIKLEIDETKKEINYLHARERPPPRDPLSILNDEV